MQYGNKGANQKNCFLSFRDRLGVNTAIKPVYSDNEKQIFLNGTGLKNIEKGRR